MMQILLENQIFAEHGLTIACGLVLLTVAWAVWTLIHLLFYRQPTLNDHPFEAQRRAALREGNSIYRWLEPLVSDVEKLAKKRNKTSLEKLERGLVQSCEPLPWRAPEYFATKFVEGGLVSIALLAFVFYVHSLAIAVVASLITFAGYGFLAEITLSQKAAARAKIVKRRLPYAVDLLALMIQAGAGFQESLETFVTESAGHPLAEEMQAVLEQIELGRPQSEALTALNARVHDEDIAELVFALNTGEELGTPITSILRDQADQMRKKRSQWGEKAAAEAGVKAIFPGMLIVIACLLMVMTPFALPLLDALN